MKVKEEAAPSRAEASRYLEETARAVRAMKASWLRVALRLRCIRDEGLWKHARPRCSTFEEYVHGNLDINRGVFRRMMQAMEFAGERRPKFLEEVGQGGDDVVVPSYDVLNQLRRARSTFEGREGDFEEIESRVYEGGLGRIGLKREIEERISTDDSPTGVAGDAAPGAGESAVPAEDDSLESIIEELRGIESRLLAIGVPGEPRKLLFRLIESLQASTRSPRA